MSIRYLTWFVGVTLGGVLLLTLPGCPSGGSGFFKPLLDLGGGGDKPDMAMNNNGPTCSDKKQNAAETDVDCGGGTCPKCAVGLACMGNADCDTNRCVMGKCAPIAASCLDSK